MALTKNLWYLGAQFMAGIQAREQATVLRQLKEILRLVEAETRGRFSHYKLRTLQILTNANRAAFNAGASTDQLAEHSRHIVAAIDAVDSPARLEALARAAVEKTVSLVPKGDAYADRTVTEAIAYIRDHYAEPLTRGQLAALLRCSPAHFSRLFSRTTGYSFKDFLLQCRLEKGKELLRSSRLNVAEIAAAVGYEDPFQFSKVFRKRVGISPRQYRESQFAPRTAPAADVRSRA
jgi:AraC-like DNA-binding protein